MSMASMSRTTTMRRRLGALIAGAMALTAASVATAGAAPRVPMEGRAAGLVRLGADTRPRSLSPGFLLDRGRYTTIEAPGATGETGVGGINNRGVIVGGARGGGRPDRGFMRDTRGRFTAIRYPGARSTLASKINDRGQLVSVRAEPDGTVRGFVLERGRFTVFAAPGAGVTVPFDINNRGQIVGFTGSDLAADAAQGFLLAKGAKGPFTPIRFPGAPSTLALGLNDRGQITGVYNNPNPPPSPPPATTPPMARMA